MPMNKRATQRLIQWIIASSVIWLVVLPWIARWEAVERHLRFLEERHIDASAMFYTELESRPVE